MSLMLSANLLSRFAGCRMVGFTGPAQSGKNAAGDYLAAISGAARLGFADTLKQSILATDPLVSLRPKFIPEWLEPVCPVMRLERLVTAVGWDRAKHYPDVRGLLQRFGTEGGREVFGPDFWVRAAEERIRRLEQTGWTRFVFTDVRFPEEVDFIQQQGGAVFRIRRPGVTPLNSHASEQPLSEAELDFGIVNNDSLDALHALVRFVGQQLGWVEGYDDQNTQREDGVGAAPEGEQRSGQPADGG